MVNENRWTGAAQVTAPQKWLGTSELDTARERLERGPGGDVDADGRLSRTGLHYVPSLKSTISAWLRLYERMQDGLVGGKDDGDAGEAGGAAR